ncbi:NADH:ubiquinone oxidoreductase [Cognatiyoonia sp.]|uniref:NADH:ubiquinone oxidoreductase n=1 Tax=Cognatiyoonia sp. TaxID=2211652 RepID=UPI003F6A157C
MKDTAPKSTGILAAAALFGIVAAGVAWVMYEFSMSGGFIVGLIVALIVALLLWLGWREPQAGPQGARDLNPGAPGAGKAEEANASAPSASAATSSASVATATAASAAAAAPGAAPKSKAAAKPKAEAKPKRARVAADGKPEMLNKARAGGADDLKQIKGVGPKLEKMLNTMGVYHFDQVAGWRAKEVKWVDENLEGFKGRVSRDEWVKQAKVLAKGGTTEFSKKAKKGGVY